MRKKYIPWVKRSPLGTLQRGRVFPEREDTFSLFPRFHVKFMKFLGECVHMLVHREGEHWRMLQKRKMKKRKRRDCREEARMELLNKGVAAAGEAGS